MLRLAMLAFAPPTDSGVWLDEAPRPGTAVVVPLLIEGETQALEGVLKVELYVVRGATATLVETYEPALPVGTIPFEFTWDPAGERPGTVTIRVVATTLARGFRAEAPGLVVPRARVATPPPAMPRGDVRDPAEAAVVRPAPRAAPARPAAAAPRLDDSGTAFGRAAPVLPYARRVAAPRPRPAPVAAPEPLALPAERSGWASVAGGLLLLVVCSHLHRALRTQPEQRDDG